MATIDMTDIITDPDLCEQPGLSYARNVQTVDATTGLASDAETVTAFSGVVCAADGSSMTRSPDGEAVESNITVHTVTRLTAGKPGATPADIVIWQGARYTVMNVNDYSNFGAGFVAATCDLITVQGG